MKKRIETRHEQNMEKRNKKTSSSFLLSFFCQAPSLPWFFLFSLLLPSLFLVIHFLSFSLHLNLVLLLMMFIPMLFLMMLHSPTNSCVTFNDVAIAQPPQTSCQSCKQTTNQKKKRRKERRTRKKKRKKKKGRGFCIQTIGHKKRKRRLEKKNK